MTTADQLSPADLAIYAQILQTPVATYADLVALLKGPVNQLLPHNAVALAIGEDRVGQIKPLHFASIGFPAEHQADLERNFTTALRGALMHWIKTLEPIIIDFEDPPAYVTEYEMDEHRRYQLDCIAGHGQLDISHTSGSYFSFAGVERGQAERQRLILRMIVPRLHEVFVAVCRNAAPSRFLLPDERVRLLSPREQEVVRLALAGLSDKAIARSLNITDKTVRNTLSRAYAKLGVRSRNELNNCF